jgi:hypothetical protein
VIDLEKLKRVAGEATRMGPGADGVAMRGRKLLALLEALECAVGALDQIQQIMFHPDGRIMLDDEANSAQVKIARDASVRISALIGKGEGEI